MIKAIVLYHPQSAVTLNRAKDFVAEDDDGVQFVDPVGISCGMTRCGGADLHESSDFSPSYASWNGVLFETSIILTVWKHADRMIGDDDVAFLHTDVRPNGSPSAVWNRVRGWLAQDSSRAISLTVNSHLKDVVKGDTIGDQFLMSPSSDPMMRHQFEYGVGVWDLIQKYDPNLFDWAVSTQPKIVYAHQFACSRAILDRLGSRLYEIASRMPLADCGLWTPHVFERIIGLLLVYFGGPAVHSTCFWHYHSSGSFDPSGLKLYGHRPYRFWLPDGTRDKV